MYFATGGAEKRQRLELGSGKREQGLHSWKAIGQDEQGLSRGQVRVQGWDRRPRPINWVRSASLRGNYSVVQAVLKLLVNEMCRLC